MKKVVWRSIIVSLLASHFALSSCKGDDDDGGDGDGDGDGDSSSGGMTGDGDGDTPGDGDGDEPGDGDGDAPGDGDGDGAGGSTGGVPGEGGAPMGGLGGMGGGESPTAGSCDNPPAPSPNVISETQKTGIIDEPAGGTIADGLYYLSEFNIYPSGVADEHVRARLLLIEGNQVTFVNVDDGGEAMVGAGTYTASSTELQFDVTCPATDSVTVQYTATSTELWLFDLSEPNVQIYTRQ